MITIEKLLKSTTRIHLLATCFGIPRYISRRIHRTPGRGHLPFSRCITEVAQVEYEQAQHQKVPRWILRLVLHFLSLSSAFPPFVVADCLMIIALEIGCDLPDIYEVGREVCSYLIVIHASDPESVHGWSDSRVSSLGNSISAVFHYVMLLGQGGH